MLTEDGLRYPKLQTWVGFPVPSLVKEAADLAGYEYGSLWVRDRIARCLAAELADTEDAMTYEEIMESMPPSRDERPGFIKRSSQPGKSSVQSGIGG